MIAFFCSLIIILVFFFILAIFAVWSKFRRTDLRLGMAIFWTIFWILAGVVVVSLALASLTCS